MVLGRLDYPKAPCGSDMTHEVSVHTEKHARIMQDSHGMGAYNRVTAANQDQL